MSWQVARNAAWAKAGQTHWRKIVYGTLVLKWVLPVVAVLVAAGVIVWGVGRAWSASGGVSVSWPDWSWPSVGLPSLPFSPWWLLVPVGVVVVGVVSSYRFRYRVGSMLRLR